MSFPDLHRFPDALFYQTGECDDRVVYSSAVRDVSIALHPDHDAHGNGRTAIHIETSTAHPVSLRRIWLRWRHRFAPGVRFLGDAWERSYGELEWRGSNPHRVLPWYFLCTTATCAGAGHTAGYGVMTGAASFASWRADADGVTLELDVRSGGVGVRLGSRRLHAATIIQRLPCGEIESPFEAARALCRALCPHSLTPGEPIVGHNDWYWLYGKNSAALILDATRRFLDLYPTGTPHAPRPWSVIDDGWQLADGPLDNAACNGGPWDRGTSAFPDLPGLASDIKRFGARPGIWMRPLLTRSAVPESWMHSCPRPADSHRGNVLDPTVPGVLDLVRADITRLREWGFELIKHDFSTFDITGRWGFEMNVSASGVTADGWAFSDRTRTTAEIIRSLYQIIRDAAGPDVTLIGCNAVGHLAAGLVEIQRIGDDTSATDWDRTRRMGINTLAFRAAQHGTFFAADADCVPVSPHIPAHLTAAWLDLVARSGTPLFLSIDPAACRARDHAIREAIRRSLAAATHPATVAEPLDWIDTAIPGAWRLRGGGLSSLARFGWSEWDLVSQKPLEGILRETQRRLPESAAV